MAGQPQSVWPSGGLQVFSFLVNEKKSMEKYKTTLQSKLQCAYKYRHISFLCAVILHFIILSLTFKVYLFIFYHFNRKQF